MTEAQAAVSDEVRRQTILASPYMLGRYWLGYDKFSDTQIMWDRWIRERIHRNQKKRKGFKALILQPREVFKSTFFTITLPTWILANDIEHGYPNTSILIANEVFANSVGFLRELRGGLDGKEFKENCGDWKSGKWSDTELVIRQRTKAQKEPSIGTCGLGNTITSRHYDVCILDDLAGPNDRDSAAKRKQTFNFFTDIWDIVKKDRGIVIMVGTRWHVRDIYYHIKEVLNPQLEKQGLDKFEILEKPAKNQDGSLNFPNLLSEKKLKELRTVKLGEDGLDYASYMAQYMLTPLDPRTQVFKDFHYYTHSAVKYDRFVQWTDPALSEKKTACYSAVVVLGKIADGPHKNKWGVCYASVARRAPSKLVEDHNRIYLMHKEIAPTEVYMEDNGFQLLLKDKAIKDALQKGKLVPTVGKANRKDKVARIRSMEPFVTTGLLMFRDDHRDAPEGYRLLVEQLKNFPQGEMDAPDALQGGFNRANQSGPRIRRLD